MEGCLKEGGKSGIKEMGREEEITYVSSGEGM
jgi:hypothetical protein